MRTNTSHIRTTTQQTPKVRRAKPKVEAQEPSDSFQPSLWQKLKNTIFPPKERQWTVLYYGAGNNDLSRSLNMEMGGLRNAGSSDEIQIVGQLARDGEDGRVVRGEMAKIPVTFGAVKPEFIERENLTADMGEKQTLGDFVKWGMKNYPAKNYMVIQAGHGSGHRGSMTDETTGTIITPVEQREAFEEAPEGVDVLLKESCLGGSLEEAYEMKDTVGYYLASQDITKGSVQLFELMNEARKSARKGDFEPQDMVEAAGRHRDPDVQTFSAVDCSKLGEVGAAIADFRTELDTPEEVENARQVAAQTPAVKPIMERLTSSDVLTSAMEEKRLQYRDAKGFASELAQESGDLGRAAGDVAEALDEAILYNFTDKDHVGQQGLSWNISPDPSVTAGSAYQNLAFAKDTGWTGVVS